MAGAVAGLLLVWIREEEWAVGLPWGLWACYWTDHVGSWMPKPGGGSTMPDVHEVLDKMPRKVTASAAA